MLPPGLSSKYNVLDAGEGRGDELYGVEPASYYVKNLFLNTSVAFPLAVALPLLAVPLYPMADKVGVRRREFSFCRVIDVTLGSCDYMYV